MTVWQFCNVFGPWKSPPPGHPMVATCTIWTALNPHCPWGWFLPSLCIYGYRYHAFSSSSRCKLLCYVIGPPPQYLNYPLNGAYCRPPWEVAMSELTFILSPSTTLLHNLTTGSVLNWIWSKEFEICKVLALGALPWHIPSEELACTMLNNFESPKPHIGWALCHVFELMFQTMHFQKRSNETVDYLALKGPQGLPSGPPWELHNEQILFFI